LAQLGGSNYEPTQYTWASGLCTTGIAPAQERQTVSFKTVAENAEYTQQLFIDAGDVPGHQVRAFERHWTFPSDSPLINGVKLTEAWARAASDYTDGNGPAAGYFVYALENGDKFFARWTLAAQKSSDSGKSIATLVGTITGGTGKFSGIRAWFDSSRLSIRRPASTNRNGKLNIIWSNNASRPLRGEEQRYAASDRRVSRDVGVRSLADKETGAQQLLRCVSE
jgi:hypothetical protein